LNSHYENQGLKKTIRFGGWLVGWLVGNGPLEVDNPWQKIVPRKVKALVTQYNIRDKKIADRLVEVRFQGLFFERYGWLFCNVLLSERYLKSFKKYFPPKRCKARVFGLTYPFQFD